MILYALKSILCLLIFWAFYKILLEEENMFSFNRGYLVFSLIGSFTIPLLNIPIISPVIEEVFINNIDFVSSSSILESGSKYSSSQFLILGYGLIVIILLFKFSIQLWNLIQQISRTESSDIGKVKLLLKDDIKSPYTFMRYIFMPNARSTNLDQKEILLLHELAHARQAHSLDIIFIEMLKAIFWFNPVLYLVKKSIKLNHEFLADAAVLNENHNLYNYQQVLLSVSSSYGSDPLSSQLNYSVTKKRLKMMTKETSTWVSSSKICMSLILSVCLTFALSKSLHAQGPGVSPELIKEYKQLVDKVFDDQGQIKQINKIDAERMTAIYSSMNAEQQSAFSDFVIPPAPPAPPSPPSVPVPSAAVSAPVPPAPPSAPVPDAVPVAPAPPAAEAAPVPPAPPAGPFFHADAIYFIDGKKVSKQEAKVAYANRDEIAEIHVKKLDNGEHHVYFISK